MDLIYKEAKYSTIFHLGPLRQQNNLYPYTPSSRAGDKNVEDNSTLPHTPKMAKPLHFIWEFSDHFAI